MANYEKIKQGALGHMLKHFGRELDSNGKPINYSNSNIDLSRSHLNYNLAPPHPNDYNFIQERTQELHMLNRKDVIPMCSWCITLPKDVPESEEAQFFKETYKFLEKKYKTENIVSAYVHKDETTPHIHFAFIPVAVDKKSGKEKVCAKECVTKKDLQTFHLELSQHIARALGHEVSILTGETVSSISMDAYKALKNTEEQKDRLEEEVRGLETKAASLQTQKEGWIAQLEAAKKSVDVLHNLLEEATQIELNPKKKSNFHGEKSYILTEEEFEKLTTAAKQSQINVEDTCSLLQEFINIFAKTEKLTEDNAKLLDRVQALETENRLLKEAQNDMHLLSKHNPELFEAATKAITEIKEKTISAGKGLLESETFDEMLDSAKTKTAAYNQEKFSRSVDLER